MTTLRRPIAYALMLILGLTGIGAGMARGAMAADSVLCGNGTPRIVLAHDGAPLFDAAGEPVEIEAEPCIDCVMGTMAEPANAPQPQLAEALGHTLHFPSPPDPDRVRWCMGGHGRGPPAAA